MISETIHMQYERLLSQCSYLANAISLAKIAASWLEGEGALPQRLGLSAEMFKMMTTRYFPATHWQESAPSGKAYPEGDNPEIEELVELFLEHRSNRDDSELILARIMAMGCQASDHLWHDLGFWSRADLSAMIRENFPTLFDKNVHNMKWKKFFYKQMCMDLDATYQCRVPSCSVCVDYRECYPSTEELDDEFNKATIYRQT